MKICYVLLDGSNATSDVFYFSVEDNGKEKSITLWTFLPKCPIAGDMAPSLYNSALLLGD